MSDNLKLEKILKELDYRDIIPDQPFGKAKDMNRLKTQAVTGDQAAHSAARAEVTIDRIKDNLRSMGINAPSLDEQDTIDYYKALKKFPFSFSLGEPIPGYFGGQGKDIRGKAEVDEKSTPDNFIMYFTISEDVDSESEVYNKEENVYKILFSPKTLQKNLLGTKINLPMLLKGKIYDVRISEVSGIGGQSGEGGQGEGDQSGEGGQGEGGQGEGGQGEGGQGEGRKENTQYVKLKKEELNELNGLTDKLTNSANRLRSLKLSKFSDNKNFRDALLLNLIRSKMTNIKVNGEPISVNLKKLKDNGLLEAPLRSRDVNQKQQLPQGWENQMSTFFENLFKVFARLNRCCKSNPTYIQIKKFFKLLFLIVKEGQANYSDEKKREQLFKKLIGTITNFINSISKSNLKFTNSTKSENKNVLYNLINEIISESIINEEGDESQGEEEGKPYYDRKLKIVSVPNFAYEREDDEEGTSGSKPKGSKGNVPKGESLASNSSKITNIRGTGAGTWSSDNIQAVLNNEFKANRVLVKKSISKKDTLILYYPGIQQKLGTDAILISAENISNLFTGKKLKNYTVKVGPKISGKDEFKQEGEAEITVLPS